MTEEKSLETIIGKRSMREAQWSTQAEFHQQTKFVARLSQLTWYVVAEAAVLSQKGEPPRWSEQSSSFDEYWTLRGVENIERLDTYIEYWQWIQQFDPSGVNDPPQFLTMHYIFSEKSMFESHEELRRYVFTEGYSVEELKPEVRKRKKNSSVKKSRAYVNRFPSKKLDTSTDDTLSPVFSQIKTLNLLVKENSQSISKNNRKELYKKMSSLLRIVQKSMDSQTTPQYRNLGEYLVKPATIVAGYVKESQDAINKRLLHRILDVFSSDLKRKKISEENISMITINGSAILYDPEKIPYLRPLVIKACHLEFNVHLQISKGNYIL